MQDLFLLQNLLLNLSISISEHFLSLDFKTLFNSLASHMKYIYTGLWAPHLGSLNYLLADNNKYGEDMLNIVQ